MYFPPSGDPASSTVAGLLQSVPLPRVAPVAQRYDRPRVHDVEAELARLLREKGSLAALQKGQRIAITAGSRGIVNLPLALRTIVREVRAAGGDPFLVPAMGSHGGASAEGQLALLKGLGIDEATVEAPILSSMETVAVGTSANGLPAYMDKYAAEADGVITVNRVKPHTSFRGAIESGVLKMLVIGLGKQKGADVCHNAGFGRMGENVAALAETILANKNILCGVALLENAFHETARLEVLAPGEMIAREPDLLREAWNLAPKIFFDSLDVLIIDEIGKDISGTGFDCNVVGRFHNPHAHGGPDIARVGILDITDKSRGSGYGIGLADFTTRRAYDKFLPEQSYPNALTTTATLAAKMPMVLANDRQAIQAAVKTCNRDDLGAVRLVRIKNTIDMETVYVSESLKEHCLAHPNLTITGEFAPFAFNGRGDLW
ncbi:Iron-sulfur cluster-binding protein [uncultured delta proteobacterium]|uniref:Iron-sulfur cluster-binding protein n=1 Tax=uncultured delta proteobacterium TaxID=34034 RepID=A0A212K2X5_9DELT|nr:Iron-sulfur cluster-binding protein [uncultured delta proteobacterium]